MVQRQRCSTVRWVAPVMTAFVALFVAGCAAAPASPTPEADEQLHVVTSTSILADFVHQLAGDEVRVTSLVPVGGDPHVHEPTPSDARAVHDADLVIGNGVGLEPWFDTLVGDGDDVVMLADAVSHLVVDDEDGRPDPHLWMVPTIAAVYAEHLADELGARRPDDADAYRSAAADYRERLERLDAELAGRLAAIPEEHRTLVTSHDAYHYFADHYGLQVHTVVGVSTEEEPSAARVQHLVDVVRRTGVPTVFVETTVNPAVMHRIAEDAGAAVGDPLYGDSLGPPGSGADDYVGMMRANVEALVDGLAR